MQFIFFQNNKEKQLFIIVCLLSLLGAFTFSLWYFFGKEATEKPPIIIEPYFTELPEINFSFLQSDKIKEKVFFPTITLPEKYGRDNPFAPF